MDMVRIGGSPLADSTRARRVVRWAGQAVVLGSAVVILGACGKSAGAPGASAAQDSTTNQHQATSQTKTENVTLTGKIDADSGAPGTFTGKDDWPALAPSDIHVTAGATVTLTIKEYDDMVTALPAGSPYNKVMGGTETVDGQPVTSVGNDKIAHTITIPALGINIPLPKAPEDGFTTVTFTFTAPKSGSYEWRCMTPCGGGPNGMGGAMQTEGWMRGNLVVA